MTTYLFIHQSFPAQYVHLAKHLAAQPEHEVYFLTQNPVGELPGVRKVVYEDAPGNAIGCHPYVRNFEQCVRTGLSAMAAMKRMRDQQGIHPQIVIGHSGWGETLFVKDVYPDAKVIAYFEYFYRATGADVGFDPEFAPSRPDDAERLRIRNAINYAAFDACDYGHTATEWQKSLFPSYMQERIHVLHEGIDTDEVKPDPDAVFEVPGKGIRLTRKDKVLTFVARNLEPHRGFHTFMRALPEVFRQCPDVQVVIVGGDGWSYSGPPPYADSYKHLLLDELRGRLPLERVHFTGLLPRAEYIKVLQTSAVHAYMSYPFVPSWSLLEAAAAGSHLIVTAHIVFRELLGDRCVFVDNLRTPLAPEVMRLLSMKPLAASGSRLPPNFAVGNCNLKWTNLICRGEPAIDTETSSRIHA